MGKSRKAMEALFTGGLIGLGKSFESIGAEKTRRRDKAEDVYHTLLANPKLRLRQGAPEFKPGMTVVTVKQLFETNPDFTNVKNKTLNIHERQYLINAQAGDSLFKDIPLDAEIDESVLGRGTQLAGQQVTKQGFTTRKDIAEMSIADRRQARTDGLRKLFISLKIKNSEGFDSALSDPISADLMAEGIQKLGMRVDQVMVPGFFGRFTPKAVSGIVSDANVQTTQADTKSLQQKAVELAKQGGPTAIQQIMALSNDISRASATALVQKFSGQQSAAPGVTQTPETEASLQADLARAPGSPVGGPIAGIPGTIPGSETISTSQPFSGIKNPADRVKVLMHIINSKRTQ